jgi:hypothetical protein
MVNCEFSPGLRYVLNVARDGIVGYTEVDPARIRYRLSLVLAVCDCQRALLSGMMERPQSRPTGAA